MQAKHKIKFTDLAIQRLKCPESGQVLYWDAVRQNVTLLVGRKSKTFRYGFRFNDKWISAKLGTFSDTFRVKDAYAAASMIDVKVRQGAYVRKRKRKGKRTTEIQAKGTSEGIELTYLQVVKMFVELHASRSMRTWKDCERTLTRNFEGWHNRSFKNITQDDAMHIIEGFISDGTVAKAEMCHSWLRVLWRWAKKRRLIDTAIMDDIGVTFPARAARDRVYSDREITAIWNAAGKLSVERAAFFKLLILLSPRKSELAGMKFSDIKNGIWIVPFELTKSRLTSEPRQYIVPLPALVRDILSTLPKGEGRVFPGMPIHPSRKEIRPLIKSGAPSDFIYHAVRHTISTWLENKGASHYERALVLNHAGGGGVVTNYSHGHSTALKLQLLESWAKHVSKLVGVGKVDRTRRVARGNLLRLAGLIRHPDQTR